MTSPGIPPTIHLRFIRGTEADIAAAAAASQFDTGEPIWATDTRRLYVATAANSVSLIGPATALPLTEYFHLPSNNISTGNNIFEGISTFRGDTIFNVTITGAGTVARWPSVNASGSSSSALLPETDSSNRLATTEWVRRYFALGNLPDRVAIRDRVNVFTENNTFTSNVIFNDPIAINEGGTFRGVNDFTLGTIIVPTQPINGPYDGKAASTQFVRDYIQQFGSGVGSGYAKLAESNTFSGATTHDFSNTSSLLAPIPSTSWSSVESGDERVATLGWIKSNLPIGPNLLNTNNTWAGSNTWQGDSIFNRVPIVSQALSPLDNSNKVPTTSWVRNLINTQLGMGNGPVVSKSPASADSIEWTSGTVLIAGENFNVDAGSYRYTGPAGSFYVVAVRGTGSNTVVDAHRTALPTSQDETLIATVTVVDNGPSSFPRYEVAGVTNATTNFGEYARRNEDNTFTKKNTFRDEVTIQVTPGSVLNGASFRRSGIDLNSSQVNVNGNLIVNGGKATGNYQIVGADENNRTLATTEWVSSKLTEANSFFRLDNQNLLPKNNFTGVLDMRTRGVLAPHPPSLTTSDNSVATTKWVQDLILGRPNTPQVSKGPGLTIIWTAGTVKIPDALLCSKQGVNEPPPHCDDGNDHDHHHHYHHHYHHHEDDDSCHIEPSCSPPPPPPSCDPAPACDDTPDCVDHEYCQVPASTIPMPVTEGMRYVYVRYADCAVVVSPTRPDENYEGFVIAELSVSCNNVIVTLRSTGGWAPLASPAFVGRPTGPEPPANVCDDQLATTGWVCDRLYDILHKPCDGLGLPRVYRVGNTFQVNITAGRVPKPQGLGGGYCEVNTLPSPVSVVIGQTEYHWIRYRDCRFVVSTSRPNQDTEGFLLATSVTTSSDVIITLVAQAVQHTAFTKNYVVGYGGNLIYIGPEEC